MVGPATIIEDLSDWEEKIDRKRATAILWAGPSSERALRMATTIVGPTRPMLRSPLHRFETIGGIQPAQAAQMVGDTVRNQRLTTII